MTQEIKRLFKGIHSSRTLHKIIRENPEIAEYVKKQVEKYPYYEKIGYYIIAIANDLEIKKCPICGKQLTYTQCIKNKKIFCSRSCSAKKQFSKKKEKEKIVVNKKELLSFDIFPEKLEVTENAIKSFYKGISARQTRYILKKNSRVFDFCKERVECEPAYQTEGCYLWCVANNQNLKKCSVCGKTLTYFQTFLKPSKTCSLQCAHLSSSYKEKQKESHLDRKYEKLKKHVETNGFSLLSTREDYNGFRNGDKIYLRHNICGLSFSIPCANFYRDFKCPKCDNSPSLSFEKEVRDYLYELEMPLLKNTKSVIDNRELDIYLPDKKIAIECDGLYWHSQKRGKTENYHLDKTKACEKQGIFLVHIFEDEWDEKKSIVKNRLKHILGKSKYKIGARECDIREISFQRSEKFLNKYHIQGNSSSLIRYGLFKKNRLLAVMTFGKSRFNKKYDWELLRYCTIPNFNIIGGASKLLSHFRKEHKGSIISYADKRWSNGNLYRRLGFTELKDSSPNYFYTKDIKRFSRNRFQKHKLSKLLKNFNPDLTEKQNMLSNGYSIIWDCGNKVFVLKES